MSGLWLRACRRREGSLLDHERAHGETRITLTSNRSQHVEIALDTSGLCARRHHAPFDPHPDVERDLAEADSRSDQGVLAFAFEQHVRPETTWIPRSRRRGRHKRHPCTGAVVECPRGAVEQLPVTRRLVLEVDHVLVASSGLRRSRTQRNGSAEPSRQRLVVSCQRTIRQRDLRSPVGAHACRREQQLRNAPGGQTHSGLHVVDRELTIAFETIRRHGHASSRSPCSDLTG